MGAEWITSVKFKLGRSMPSLAHWLTKTMAASEETASAAAAPALVPSLNCTLAPGAFAWIALIGEDGSQITVDQHGGQGLPSVAPARHWETPAPSRRPKARQHQHGSDDGDRLQGRSVQRKQSIVLEQNRALLFRFLRDGIVAYHIDRVQRRGMIKDTGRVHGAQNAVDHVVQTRLRHLAARTACAMFPKYVLFGSS